MLQKVLLVFAAYFSIFFCCYGSDVSAKNYLDYNDSYNYSDIKEIVAEKLSEISFKMTAEKSYPCTTTNDCFQNYTKGIEYAMALNSNLVHQPSCDYGECTCGSYCRSRSMKVNNHEWFYYCGPCGRVGSSCSNKTCSPSTVVECKDNFCTCKNGDFCDIYYCYFSYYGYEIALQLAISTCIAIALCLLVASIYNAIGFRRLRRMQDLRNILRSETGVSESPPDDIPPKYDDVVEEVPSYQDAIKMFKSSPGNQMNGVVNEAFEDDLNSSQDEVRKEEPPPAYSVTPEINPKKRYKTSDQNIERNSNTESNKNHSKSCDSEEVMNNLDEEVEILNQNDCPTTSTSNTTENVSLRSESKSESQYFILNNNEEEKGA